MKRIFRGLFRFFQYLLIASFALGVFLALTKGWEGTQVHALPEYSTRTGEPCAACHVNPGGGGPRTLRGLLWAARGRPDAVPELPSRTIAASITDGADLYEISCAGCHGIKGEGRYAFRLTGTGMSKAAIRSFTLNGIPQLGMPDFAGQFSDTQLEALLDYLAGLASGEIQPLPDEYPLAAPSLTCDPVSPVGKCGGN